MAKKNRTANFVLVIKQQNKILEAKEFNKYNEALTSIKDMIEQYDKATWNIHQISKTITPEVKKSKGTIESRKEKIDKKYSIEEIHALFDKWDEEFGGMAKRTKERIKTTFDGYPVKTYSDRYRVFRLNTECVVCGLKGSFYRLEKSETSKHYHFNLYGEKDGEEILFTKDHILPRAKGGKNSLDNYQTMCQICNYEKADQVEISTGVYKVETKGIGNGKDISNLRDPSGERNVAYILSL